MNAINIKTYLIDFLLKNNPTSIIGSEVMFGFKKNIADIIRLTNGKTYAYEIKGVNDDYRRLENQIQSYGKVFDYLYVVVTQNHLEYCTKLSDKIGIIVIDENCNIIIRRKARLNKSLDKREILESITAQFLKAYFGLPRNKTSFQLRKSILVRRKGLVKKCLYDYWNSVIKPRFDLFLMERGSQTHVEDIYLLSMRKGTII